MNLKPPVTYSDERLDAIGRRVTGKALEMLDELLEEGANKIERIEALASVISAASNAWSPDESAAPDF